MFKYLTFDIEARDWNKFLIAGSYDIEYDDYREHYSIDDFIEFLFSKENKQTKVYSHFGGIYDFLFILDYYLKNPEKVEFNRIINQGSKLLSFELKRGKRRISFVCSSGLFPYSLKELTHTFNVPHKKLDEDVSNIKKVTKKLRKYLEHDCRGLAEAIAAYESDPYIQTTGLKLTDSSQALACFKEFFCFDLPVIKNDVAKFVRESYLGGRTEIFKPVFESSKKEPFLYEQDLNSLYPSVMHDFTYPGEFDFFSSSIDWSYEHFIVHCRVTAPKNLYIPLLGIKHDGKFIFPVGTFEGHFCSPEIRKALELGYKIEKVYRCAHFRPAGKIFKKFIHTFYEKRKNSDNEVQKTIYKGFMNKLYGRLAIRQERECFSFKRGKKSRIHCDYDMDGYTLRLYAEDKTLRTYSNPALSSFVTSYGRLRLYSYFEKVDFNVYYCDTDSIYSPIQVEDSKELGEMKLEDVWERACFVLPKTYAKYSLKRSALDIKMKGFPSKKGELSHITYKDFLNCIDGTAKLPSAKFERGIARFKTGLKKGNVLTVLGEQEKELKATYDKRILIKGKKWDTKPITLEYQTELFEN